jgi:hypothetical protein
MFWIWKDKVTELESKIAAAEQEIKIATNEAQLFFKHGRSYAQKLDEFFAPPLTLNMKETEAFLSDEFTPCVRGWGENDWKSWLPDEALLEEVIRIGEYVEFAVAIYCNSLCCNVASPISLHFD